MAASFGISFGNTSACIALSNDGKADVLANDAGHRVTASVVAYTDHDQVVGASARQGLIRNSQNTVCNVKQLIGRQFNDPIISAYQKQESVKVVENPKDQTAIFSIQYKEKTTLLSPGDVMTSIFNKMLETANSTGVNGSVPVVLTVPLEFTTEQRQIITSAAQSAGFDVLRVINEPSAAVLAYDIAQNDIHDDGTVLVLRVGGTSTTVTVVRVLNGLYRILSSVTSPTGGHEYTDKIVHQLTAEFTRKHRHDVTTNPRSMIKLKMAAETCKHSLTRLDNAPVAIDSLYDGIDFHVSSSRLRFESSVLTLVQSCQKLIQRAIGEAEISPDSSLTKDDIHKVVLCGGGSNVPILQKSISEYLPQATILSTIPPEEVMAIGAAKQASILICSDKEELEIHDGMTEIDSTLEDIHFSVSNTTDSTPMSGVLFYSHTPLPARKHHSYTLQNSQSTFSLDLYTVNRDGGQGHQIQLGNLFLEDLEEGASVSVTYHLRREGSLHVTCTDKATNKEQSLLIETAENHIVED